MVGFRTNYISNTGDTSFGKENLKTNALNETTLENIQDNCPCQIGTSFKVTDVGLGVQVTSDGYSYRGSERFVNGFSVSSSGDLLFNGMYCRELGVNAYSLITELVSNSASVKYQTILNECAAMGVRVVRVSLTPYTSTTFLAQVCGGILPKKLFCWDDLSPSYQSAVKTVFDYAASLGIYLIPSIIWQPDAVSGMFSETTDDMYSSALSRSRIFSRSFVKAFVNEYKSHVALGMYALGNEFKLTNGTYHDDSKVIQYLTDLASVVKTLDPSKCVCSGNLGETFDGTLSRPSFQAIQSKIQIMNPSPLDTLDVHAYADRAWLSSNSTNILNSTSLDSYCYATEWVTALVKLGKESNKPLVISEVGILGKDDGILKSTGQEYFGDTDKLTYLLESLFSSGVQLALVWNIGDTSSPIQKLWDFSLSNGERGSSYQRVLKKWVQKFRTSQTKELGFNYFNPVTKGFPKPESAATFTAASNVNIQYPTTNNLMYGDSNGTILFWANVSAANTAYARLIAGCDSAGSARGWQILMNTDGLEPYLSFIGAGVNAAGKTNPLTIGTPSMRGWTWSGTALNIYVDGFWYDSKTLSVAPIARQSGDPFVIGTNYNGASGFAGWIAGVVYCNRVMTPREIADYYNYGTVPSDAVCFPLDYDGVTTGGAVLTPSSISGSVTFAATSLAY